MRVLMLHNRYQLPGGEDVSTAMQIAMLRDAGHDVELLEEDNDRVDAQGKVRTATGAIWSRGSHRRVTEALRDGDWDVMHVENFFPLFSPSVYYAAAREGVPVVQSLRNFRLLCPQPMLFRDGQICELCVGRRFAWPGIKYGCYRSSRTGSAVVAVMSAGHAAAGTWRTRVAHYVAPSDFAKSMFTAAGWDPSRMTVVPNFVHPVPTPGSGSGGYALFVGRLTAAKGIPTLLEAWTSGGLDMQLKIIGEGPLGAVVSAAARTHAGIELLGPRSLEDTYELMGDAAFIVAPSQVYETFGRVVVEAAAKGTPAIASDLGGLSELVAHGESGYLFPPGSAAELTDRVKRVVANEQLLRAMREKARSGYLQRYSGELSLNRLEAVYRRAQSGRAAGQ